jgi:flagellar L-ring protein FlgH
MKPVAHRLEHAMKQLFFRARAPRGPQRADQRPEHALKQISLTLVLFAATACSAHIEPYQAKKRDFDPGAYPEAVHTSSGSLFRGGLGGFAEDERPTNVGDVVVIRIDESDSASHDSSTQLDRSSDTSFGLSGALEKLDPQLGLPTLFGAQSDYNFDGGGRIQRRGRVNAMLPVRVRRVLPNGDLYIEGSKVVLVGEEERHLYLSGIARRVDVRADGSILSSRIAEAEIEYTGKGDATDQERQGWFSRFLSYIWPF